MSRATESRRESLIASMLLALIINLICSLIGPCGAATFGSWVCSATRGRSSTVVSKGDFTSLLFMPFLSPFQSQEECSAQRYLGDVECTYDVTAPVDHVIYGEFIAFSLDADCSSDFARVQQVDKPKFGAAPLDMTFCGVNSGQYFTVAGQKLTMTFKADSEHSCEGFSGFFTVYKPSLFSIWQTSLSSTLGYKTNTPYTIDITDPKVLSYALRNDYKYKYLLSINRYRMRTILRLSSYCDALERACGGVLGVGGACVPSFCTTEPLLSTRRGREKKSLRHQQPDWQNVAAKRRQKRAHCLCRKSI